MILAGKHVFHETNVAFHILRPTLWEPWEIIGVYLTTNTYANCRYIAKYQRIVGQFKLEVKDAERGIISGSKEFLELWRADHKDNHSLITPIINYCTAYSDFPEVLSDLYTCYVGNNSAKTFARMAIMLKQRDRHFPSAMAAEGTNTELKKALIEAQLI